MIALSALTIIVAMLRRSNSSGLNILQKPLLCMPGSALNELNLDLDIQSMHQFPGVQVKEESGRSDDSGELTLGLAGRSQRGLE